MIVPALLAGLAILFWLTKNRPQPERLEYAEVARTVRTIEVPAVTMVPRFIGHGNVKPSQVWNGIAQVSGKVISIDPLFKKGTVVPQGQFLLQIDPSDHELVVRQVETDLEATRARLAEIDVQEENSHASLQIEQDSLEISQAEVERKRRLADRGTMSSSEYEQEQRNLLAQRQSVQSLKNTIALYPVERRRLNAELARLNAQLASAKLDLERTTVSMPFTARVAEVNAELFQFLREGDRLGIADSIERAEVEVQIPMWRVAPLVRAVDVSTIEASQTRHLGAQFGLSARVFLGRDALHAQWSGEVTRFSDTLDPRTRTIGVIIEVDRPYADVRPGIKPPLLKGLFVSAEVTGKPRPGTLVVPRSALHGGIVYVVNGDERLEMRAVETGIEGTGFHSITSGLVAGERLVVSDIVPAIEGMLLRASNDPDTLARLIEAATGAEARP